VSAQSEKLEKDREKIIKAFAQAIDPPKARNLSNKNRLKTALIISLICTMLPIQAATLFFSFMSISIFIALIKTTKPAKHLTATISALAIVSVLSGCGPVLFNEELPDFFGLQRQTNLKTYTITRIGAFGLGFSDATPEQAQFEGNIEELTAVKIDRGYGLISMVRISVAGKG